MTDTELNEQVARKLGHEWPVVNPEHAPNCPFRKKNYCTDIAAAWEIVEWLEANSMRIDLLNCYPAWIAEHPNEKWKVFIARFNVMHNPNMDVFADTAPMAICVAFLKLP